MKRLFAQRRSSSWWVNLRVTVATILLCLLWAEVAGRLLSPRASIWEHPNYIVMATQLDNEHALQMRHDPELGHEPVPGFKGMLQDKPISFSAQGLRNHNGERPAANGPATLVLGDSVTEGYLVGDDETWPAELERATGRRVLNAAVRAYGIDQMVLRAERLAPALKPPTLVLAFIPDDVARTELSLRYNTPKPYFVLDGLGLKLANAPVPPPGRRNLNLWREIFGHSYLVDFTMRRLGLLQFWYGSFETAHHDGEEVSCRLMARFAELAGKLEARALVVALYEDHDWTDPERAAADRRRSRTVLACAGKAGLGTLDTWDGFERAGVDRDLQAFYLGQHLTPRGNALAGQLVAAALEGTAK